MKKYFRIFLIDDFNYIGEIKDEDDDYVVLKKISGEVIKINRKFITKILEEKDGEKYV